MAAQDRQVAGKTGIEITGPEPWPVGFAGALPRSSAIPVRILIAPQPRARTSIAELRGRREVVVWASDPSAVEAAVLITAGANAYVTELDDLAAAIRAVTSGEIWLAPVAAAAVCRLARITRDPHFDKLSVAARAAARGQAWPLACLSTGLTQAQSLLTELRWQL
jgi:DNA-binding NarL/FixJ family response regulator